MKLETGFLSLTGLVMLLVAALVVVTTPSLSSALLAAALLTILGQGIVVFPFRDKYFRQPKSYFACIKDFAIDHPTRGVVLKTLLFSSQILVVLMGLIYLGVFRS
ncbi:MAG: hypothetical protein Q8K62_00870 [Thiobacillus sp.]|nr:hypothetical protein [Thiobacillus sp.]